jgi:integrase
VQFKHLAHHLWLRLADPDVSEVQVINSLRAHGLINVFHPKNALELSSLLHPQFLALKADLPMLAEILDGFLLAKKLYSVDIDLPDRKLSHGDDLYLYQQNHQQNQQCMPQVHNFSANESRFLTSQFASACAVQWVAQALENYLPLSALPSLHGPTEKHHFPHFVLTSVDRWARDQTRPQPAHREIADVGFPRWQAYFFAELQELSLAGKRTSEIFNVGVALRNLVDANTFLAKRQIGKLEKVEPNTHIDDGGDGNAGEKLSYPRDFSIRNLLKSHWHYPRPAEIRSLQKICSGLTGEPTSGKTLPQNYERILIALALFTGRSIAEALSFPINGPVEPSEGRWATDFLQVEVVNFKHRDRTIRTPWVFRRIQGLGTKDWIRLALPRDLSDAILSSLYVTNAAKLEHLLPLTEKSWEDRCYVLLQSALSTSRKRAELLVRDFLGRQLFALTTNAALVRLLCDQTTTAEKNGGRRQLALSYYLDFQHGRVWEAYQEACKAVIPFGVVPVSLEKDLQKGPESLSLTLSTAQFTAISTHLLKRMPAAVDTQTLIKCHNGFAEYTLFLMIAATGHRKSLTPFFFPWDICLEEKLAFISDKQVTGSEARFVPLPQLAVNQYLAYQAHLVALGSKLERLPAVAKHVQTLLASMPRFDTTRSNLIHVANPKLSQFFFIDAEYQPQTFGTNRLDRIVNGKGLVVGPANMSTREKSNAVVRVSVRRFRNGLADYLWGALKSGSKVQAWLGHAPELHSFGEASTWSVQEWAGELRPHIQQYLVERGLVYRSSPLVNPLQRFVKRFVGAPSLSTSKASYEGRAVNSKFAATRALKVLRQMLPEDYLEWQTHASGVVDEEASQPLVIDDALQLRMAQELRNRLGGDRLALDKISKTINEEFKRLKKRGAHVTAASTNLFRSDPGPVSVSFARHLRIACEIRRVWLARWVEEGLGRKEYLNRMPSERIEHLAHLAISLVIFDASLDPGRVRALTLAAASMDGLQFHPDTMTLRATITTARDIYDWLILPSPITAAQLVGLRRRSVSGLPKNEETDPAPTEEDARPRIELTWKKIDVEIGRILARMQAPKSAGAVSSLSGLCLVFRPWWHLRLPGALYSVAVGDHVGPAPSRTSEESLFAAQEPSPFENRKGLLSTQLQLPPAKAQKQVLNAINKLFSKSEGSLSKTRRSNLGKILKEPYQEDLFFYFNEQPIVQHALGFIEYLLDVGGPQQPILRFSSIRTYYSKVVPLLVEQWWDKSTADWSGADFDEAYKEIVGKSAFASSQNEGTEKLDALRQFHRYLRDTSGAPFSAYLFQQKSQPARRRSDLLTWRAVDHAARDVRNDPSIPDSGRLQAETMIAIAAGYGLRNSEITALTTDSFIGESDGPLGVAINRNRFSDIKSAAGRRVIAQPLFSSSLKRVVVAAYKRAKATEKHDVSSSRDARLIDIGKGDAIWSYGKLSQNCISALRGASSSNTAVLHSLRHTFATAMMLELFGQRRSAAAQTAVSGESSMPWEVRHGPSMTARERLVGSAGLSAIVSEILQLPGNWPFAVDLLAQILGHADVATLLGCYFHGTPVLLAEYTHGYSRDADLVDERLALLLGLERSTVTKRRKSFVPHDDKSFGTKLTPIEQVISFDLTMRDRPAKPLRKVRHTLVSPELESMPWDVMDDLLLQRMAAECSFEVMKEQAIEVNVGAAKAALFVASYRRLVEETGFDDFEFKGSELADHMPTRTKGVLRAKQERQTCLRILQSKSFADRQLRASLCLIAKIWSERTDPQDPWLVLKDEYEAQALESMFRALEMNWHREPGAGATMQSQFNDVKVYMTGTPAVGLLQYLKSAGISPLPDCERPRFSRSGGRIKASEVGVQFVQRVNARIGDGRDAHRLFLVLAAALLLPTQI